LNYLQSSPETFFARKEIARRAVRRQEFEENPHWADAPLAGLLLKKLIEQNESGLYRLKKSEALPNKRVHWIGRPGRGSPMARLDEALVERQLCESREKAKRAVMSGNVKINGQKAAKPGQKVTARDTIELTAPERFVSRGGLKLEHALVFFQLDVTG